MAGKHKINCWCGALLGTKGHPDPHLPPVERKGRGGFEPNPDVFYPGPLAHVATEPPHHGHSHAPPRPKAKEGAPAPAGRSPAAATPTARAATVTPAAATPAAATPAAATPGTTATVTLTLADNLAPEAVTLAAQSATLSLGPNVRVADAAGAFGVLSNAGSAETLVEVSANVGTIWSVGPVNLRNNTQVHGDVHTAGAIQTQPGAAISGTATPNVALATRSVDITVTFPATTDDRKVNDGNDLELPPGSYRDVTLNDGGIILRSGGYYFNSLVLNSGTRLRVDTSKGSVFVNVMSTFIQRATESLITGSLNALRVVCFGAVDVPIESPFGGTVVAPRGTIRLQANGVHSGAFFGGGIFAQAGTVIQPNPFPSWGQQPPTQQPPGPGPGNIPRRIPMPSVPPPCGRTGAPPVPPPAAPSGSQKNPWDLFQIMFKACRGETPPPRKDSYLPYLVVRANPADRGQRPLPPGTVFWESPDIFVMPNQAVVGAPQVPANLGGMAQAGVPNTIFAHVWNLGRAPAFDVIVEFYWFNPTLGIELADANFIGRTVVALGPRSSAKSHAVVRCPVDWVPVFENNGHECLVVRAFSFMADPMPDDVFSATDSRHVAQRNIAVLTGPAAQASDVTLQVAPGHSTHAAQIVTIELTPAQLPWMQLITNSRNPNLRPPAAAPLVGVTPPAVAVTGGGINLGALSNDALKNVVSKQQAFPRSTDPLQVRLVTRAGLTAGEAHVVRVQQIHETTLVGGYTTVLLP